MTRTRDWLPGAREEREQPTDLWDYAWLFVPFALLLIPAVIAQTNGFQPWSLAVAALAAGWYAWMVLAHEEWILVRPVLMGVYYAGALAATLVLVALDDAFYLTIFSLYAQAFMVLPGVWAYVGVTAATAALWAQSSIDSLGWDGLPNTLLSLAIALAIGGSMRAISLQNDRRREIIAELEETSRQLAAMAEENTQLQSQLVTQARESGVHAERQRMAREIHDTLAQGLIGIITHLEATNQVSDDPRHVPDRIATAQQLARDSLAEARRSVQALRPTPLASGAMLPDALRAVTTAWSRDSGVPAGLTVTGDARPLHPEVEVALLRTAQEALANTAKHAGATRTGLTLSYMEDVVALDVIDDGAGFDPEAQRKRGPGADGGFGLTAMRQRVVRLSGRMVIESAPGQGTGVSATVPAIPAVDEDARPAVDDGPGTAVTGSDGDTGTGTGTEAHTDDTERNR